MREKAAEGRLSEARAALDPRIFYKALLNARLWPGSRVLPTLGTRWWGGTALVARALRVLWPGKT
jgi:hypothetical protein